MGENAIGPAGRGPQPGTTPNNSAAGKPPSQPQPPRALDTKPKEGPAADARQGQENAARPVTSKAGTAGQSNATEGARERRPQTTRTVLKDGYQAKDADFFKDKQHRKQLDTVLDKGTTTITRAERQGDFLAASEATRFRREALQAKLDYLKVDSQEWKETEASYRGVQVTTQRNQLLRSGEIEGDITLSNGESVDAKKWFADQISTDGTGKATATKRFVDAIAKNSPSARISDLEAQGRIARANTLTAATAGALDAQLVDDESVGGAGRGGEYDSFEIQQRLGNLQETLDRNRALENGRITDGELERYFTGPEDQAVLDGVLARHGTGKNFVGAGNAEQQHRQLLRVEGALQAQIKSVTAVDDSTAALRIRQELREQLLQTRDVRSQLLADNPGTTVHSFNDYVPETADRTSDPDRDLNLQEPQPAESSDSDGIVQESLKAGAETAIRTISPGTALFV
jgi:hypothetical protein